MEVRDSAKYVFNNADVQSVFEITRETFAGHFDKIWGKYGTKELGADLLTVIRQIFAIVADKSIQWGYEGALYGFAANQELLEHYIEVFHAEYLGILHQYQFFVDEVQARKLLEVYHYEWNET